MNKLILSLLISLACAMNSQSMFAMLHAQVNEEQKIAIKEYIEVRKEEQKERAKEIFDLIIKIVPEFYIVDFIFAPEKSLKMLEMMLVIEEFVYTVVEKHPELQTLLEQYHNEENCKYAFEEGFNTVFSWEQFKIVYMYAIASYAKDQNFKKVSREAAAAEAIPFANRLLSLTTV